MILQKAILLHPVFDLEILGLYVAIDTNAYLVTFLYLLGDTTPHPSFYVVVLPILVSV